MENITSKRRSFYLADAYMGKDLHSDVTFLLESDGTTIPAYSLIVSAVSEVLDKLIHGTGGIVNTEQVVNVPYCTRQEFLILLRYLYAPGKKQTLLTISYFFFHIFNSA